MNEQPLSPLEHVRKRPSMYIGDVTERGLTLLVGELISNAIDQYFHGDANRVSVLLKDREVTVIDDGSGMPFDLPSEASNDDLMTDHLTQFHQTPSARGHAPHVHIHSPIGVGLFVVAALCESLKIETVRDELLYRIHYCRGFEVFREILPLHSVGQVLSQGTRVEFVGDPEIFGESKPSETRLRQLSFNAAHLFAGIQMQFQEEEFYAPHGLVDYARTLVADDSLAPFDFQEVVAGIRVQATALGTEDETQWKTWSNGMETWESGTHREAFQEALDRVGWSPACALIHVVMNEPQWAGPTKTRLDIPEKLAPLSDALETALRKHLAQAL